MSEMPVVQSPGRAGDSDFQRGEGSQEESKASEMNDCSSDTGREASGTANLVCAPWPYHFIMLIHEVLSSVILERGGGRD